MALCQCLGATSPLHKFHRHCEYLWLKYTVCSLVQHCIPAILRNIEDKTRHSHSGVHLSTCWFFSGSMGFYSGINLVCQTLHCITENTDSLWLCLFCWFNLWFLKDILRVTWEPLKTDLSIFYNFGNGTETRIACLNAVCWSFDIHPSCNCSALHLT